MADPHKTYTVEEFISAGSLVPITYNNLSFIEKIGNNIECPIFNVIDDYMDELKALCVDIQLNDKEYTRYIYKPKLLAHDIYKNGELFFIILALNGICDVKEFTKKKLKMVSIENLETALTYIYNAELKSINVYNEK